LFSAVIKKLAPLRQRPWGVMNALAKALSLPADVADARGSRLVDQAFAPKQKVV
jgi:hypothetical protein